MCPHHNSLVTTYALGHMMQLHIVGTKKPKSAQQPKQGA